MRRVRIVISGVGTAMPTLVAFVVPAIDACGSMDVTADAASDATLDSKDAADEFGFPPPDADASATQDAGPCSMGTCSHVVPIPDAGVFPDLASVCAVASPVVSNTAAVVTLSNWNANAKTADGFVSIPANLLGAITGAPVINAPSGMSVQQITPVNGGYTFKAAWTTQPSAMTMKVTFQVLCGDAGLDGGVQTIESTTDLELCGTSVASAAWESSGSNCIQCCVVCEMAPTPIVSDNAGDHLPLGRALRLRVVEIARAGKQVVLFAQNDAGEHAEYDWRVSGGSFERVAADVIVWTLPDEHDAPFGQLAVSNDEGAIVENFY